VETPKPGLDHNLEPFGRIMNALLSWRKRFAVLASVLPLFLAFDGQGQDCVPRPYGLMCWWPAEGDANERMQGVNGIMRGNATFAPGKVGQAFSFDGVNSYVEVPFAPCLNLAGQITVEFWMKAAASNSMATCCQGLVTTDGYEVEVAGGGLQRVGIIGYIVAGSAGSTGDVNGGGAEVTPNTWHHIALTYDNPVVQLYIDGIKWGNPVTLAGGIISAMLDGSFLAIGSSDGRTSCPSCIGTRYFNGLIDEVGLYNRALSDWEIAAIYKSDTAGKCVAPTIPHLFLEPTNRSAVIGSSIVLAAIAGGTPPIDCQWKFNGTNIPNATNITLAIPNVQLTKRGLYSITVSNALASVTSSNAALDVVALFAFGNGQPLTNSAHNFSGFPTIQIQTLLTNGPIFYTLDGSKPTLASTAYTSPFVVSSNVILRVLGYRADFSEFAELGPIQISLPPIHTISATTQGGGAVTVNPPGGSYLSNTTVSVTATPSAGWTFLHWLGDLAGSNNPANITLTGNRQVQAVFGTTLGTAASGGGSVIKIPNSGLNPFGSVVALVAVPEAGNFFGVWGNPAGGNVNPLYFTVTNANQSVSSLFVPLGEEQWALTVIPNGFGHVTVSPRANVYSTGVGVTLTAVPDAGQSFIGWSGDATGSSNPLNVTMTTSKVITASFTSLPRLSANPPAEGLFKDGFRFSLFGEFNRNYQIDVTTNIPNWAPLTVLSNYYNQVQFLDPAGTNKTTRLYRAMRLP
jgi:hypothetical protein